jgi:outer membrane protein OmpA-like peptidoglycan-associated protein
MRVRTAPLILASLLGLSLPAAAEPTPGPFLSVGGGVNYLLDQDLSGFPGGLTEVKFDIGWAAIVAGGYRMESGVRPEIEVGYRKNDVDKFQDVAGANPSGNGEVRALSFMANLLYDFDLGGSIIPYVGVGIGGAQIDVDSLGVAGISFNDRQLAFAYQGIIGVAYQISEEVEAYADYRYFSTAGLELQDSLPAAAQIDDEYSSHTVIIGLRWTFAPPGSIPPPREPPSAAVPAAAAFTAAPGGAMPVAAPAEMADTGAAAMGATGELQREFLVFFEWDKFDLGADAKATLKQAAEYARQGGVARISVVGHADRSGPDPYNMKLSQRRAQAVWGEMVALGIDGNIIKVDWMGERQPLVPTADGVREAKNRRAQITLE